MTLSRWAFSRQGAIGVPLFTTWDPVAGSGRAPIPGNISGRSPGSILSHLGLSPPETVTVFQLNTQHTHTWGGWTWAAPVSGRGITGGGSGYAAILAHAGGVLYGTELGSVILKRVGLFCFPIKHSTHTRCVRERERERERESFIRNHSPCVLTVTVSGDSSVSMYHDVQVEGHCAKRRLSGPVPQAITECI